MNAEKRSESRSKLYNLNKFSKDKKNLKDNSNNHFIGKNARISDLRDELRQKSSQIIGNMRSWNASHATMLRVHREELQNVKNQNRLLQQQLTEMTVINAEASGLDWTVAHSTLTSNVE